MSARISTILLILFVGAYIVPGFVLGAMDLLAFVTGHAPRMPFPVPQWPAGS